MQTIFYQSNKFVASCQHCVERRAPPAGIHRVLWLVSCSHHVYSDKWSFNLNIEVTRVFAATQNKILDFSILILSWRQNNWFKMQNDDVSIAYYHNIVLSPNSRLWQRLKTLNFPVAGYLEHYQQIVLFAQSEVSISSLACVPTGHTD